MHQQPPPPYQEAPPPVQPVPTMATIQPGQPQQVVQVVQVVGPNFQPRAQDMICPHCQVNIKTSIKAEPSTLSWLIGLALCAFG